MRWRLLLGPILALVLALWFFVDVWTGRSAWMLLAMALLFGWRGAWELVQLFRVRSFSVQPWLVIGASLAIIASNWWQRIRFPDQDLYVRDPAALGPAMLVFALSLLLILWREAVRFRTPGQSMETAGGQILIVSYIGILLSFTSQLRWVAGADQGYVALGSLVVAAKCGDIGGYFFGKFWGRRKLIEMLSPGKTRMGAFGALVGAVVGSTAWFWGVAPWISATWVRPEWYWIVLFGIALGIIGLLGDLCESLIKRDTGRKDSAALLPEFGGLLDLLDSVIYAAPVAYLMWLVLPLGQPSAG